MAFLNCEVFSKTLNMATALRVILPDEGELGAANTVYLLHGLSDNSSGWTRYTAVEQYARERGLAVVMPEVQRSFYADMAAGLDYFGYVAVELPAMCERMFGLPHERTKRYVMGLSMGGYGALKCALTYPERYAGVGSFSGVVDIRRPVYSVKTPAAPASARQYSARAALKAQKMTCTGWHKTFLTKRRAFRIYICPAASRTGCMRTT